MLQLNHPSAGGVESAIGGDYHRGLMYGCSSNAAAEINNIEHATRLCNQHNRSPSLSPITQVKCMDDWSQRSYLQITNPRADASQVHSKEHEPDQRMLLNCRSVIKQL